MFKKMKHRKKQQQKRKWEWSKLFATSIATLFGIYSVWCGIAYYNLCKLAILNSSYNLPDPTLAVTCVSVVLGALLSYLLYQMGLKNSRNKFGIDENGQPFKERMIDVEEAQQEDANKLLNEVEITE